MKRLLLAAFVLSFPALALENSAKFIRACSVFLEPSLSAAKVCQKKSGARLSFSGYAENGFVQVETGDCAGYVPSGCVGEDDVKQVRIPAENNDGRKSRFRLGFGGHVDGTLASVSGSADSSRGSGWALGLLSQIWLAPRWQLTVAPVYQRLGLNGTVNLSSTVVADTNPAKFEQTRDYYGGSLLVGYAIERNLLFDRPTRDPELFLEAGLQTLFPSGGKQTGPNGTVEFKPTDKPLFLLLGVSADLFLNRSLSLGGYLHAYYNLGSRDGDKIYGARLGIALIFGVI